MYFFSLFRFYVMNEKWKDSLLVIVVVCGKVINGEFVLFSKTVLM